jgi:hypothetical protein
MLPLAQAQSSMCRFSFAENWRQSRHETHCPPRELFGVPREIPLFVEMTPNLWLSATWPEESPISQRRQWLRIFPRGDPVATRNHAPKGKYC